MFAVVPQSLPVFISNFALQNNIKIETGLKTRPHHPTIFQVNVCLSDCLTRGDATDFNYLRYFFVCFKCLFVHLQKFEVDGISQTILNADNFLTWYTSLTLTECSREVLSGPKVINNFMLNSAEHEIFPAHKSKNGNKPSAFQQL